MSDETAPQIEEVYIDGLPDAYPYLSAPQHKTITPPVMKGGPGAMKHAWALSKGDQEPVEGEQVTGKAFDVMRAAAAPVAPVKPKAEPAPAAHSCSCQHKEPEKKAKPKGDLHDILSKGKVTGMASLAYDRLEQPAIKAWQDDDVAPTPP